MNQFRLVLGVASALLAAEALRRLLEPRSSTGDWREPGHLVCRDGHRVRSEAERRIDNALHRAGIEHVYEPPVTGTRYFADFYLVREKVYVEYWGTPENPVYRQRMTHKRAAYRRLRLPLIELWPRQWRYLEAAVLGKVSACEQPVSECAGAVAQSSTAAHSGSRRRRGSSWNGSTWS